MVLGNTVKISTAVIFNNNMAIFINLINYVSSHQHPSSHLYRITILLHKLHVMYSNFCTWAAALSKLILTAAGSIIAGAICLIYCKVAAALNGFAITGCQVHLLMIRDGNSKQCAFKTAKVSLNKLNYKLLTWVRCHFIRKFCPKYIAISGTLQVFGFQNTFTGKTLKSTTG